MTIYAQANLGQTISGIVLADDAQDEAIRSHERGNVEPTVLIDGLLWNSLDQTIINASSTPGWWPTDTSDAILIRRGGSWETFADARYPQLNAGGTVQMIANLRMNSLKITGLADGTDPNDGANVGQVVLVSGANAMTGALAMGANKITGLADGTDPQDAVTFGQLGSASGNATGKSFQNLNASPIYTGATSGTGLPIVHRLMETESVPRLAEILLATELRDGDDFDGRGNLWARLSVPNYVAQADNSGVVAFPLGWIRQNSTGSAWTQLFGSVSTSHTSPQGGRVIESDIFTQGGEDWRLYVEFHDGTFNAGGITNGTGVEFYVIREDNGIYADLDELGAGGASAFLQVNVFGYN